MIVISNNDQDILTHHNQKRNLWTIFILVYISPLLIKQIASFKPKHYKYFVPKQITHLFYFNKNSNYWHEESVKM